MRRLSGTGRSEGGIDQVRDFVDLRHQILRIDEIGRFGNDRSGAQVGRRAQRDLEGEGRRLQDAARRRIQNVVVELVVIAVGIDEVTGDFCSRARAIIDQAHRVALVDQFEARTVKCPVVIPGKDEEVVLSGQTVQGAGVHFRLVGPDRGDIAVGLLAEENGTGHAVLKMQIGRHDGAVGIHQSQLSGTHGILQAQDQGTGAIREVRIDRRRRNVGDVIRHPRRGEGVVSHAPELARQTGVHVVERHVPARECLRPRRAAALATAGRR